jgi:hypothetical protein
MPLSLYKLDKIISKHELLIRKIYTINNDCVYLELLCVKTGDVCMLYIPSKYQIKAMGANNEFKVSYIEINEDGTIPEDYAGEPDNFELENTYNEVDIDLKSSNKNMEGHLEESYNHPLSLKDMSKNDKTNLREIFRQLRRLKFCVQNLKYKLCITYKGYLCCIRRDDTFECFHVKASGNMDDNRSLIVTFDLETFYSKIDIISEDIKTIKNGIYKVLDKNQVKHTNNLYKILEYKTTILTSSEIYLKNKKYYTNSISKLELMLVDLCKSEEVIFEKISEIKERYNNNSSLKGLHKDIEKSHLLSKHETELTNINSVKQEIISNLMSLKEKRETLSLKLDKIFFDNTIMIDAIIKNFELLSEI